MSWDYRVIHYDDGKGRDCLYGIHEVYRDDDGSICGWRESAEAVTGENVEDVKETLEYMRHSFKLPVLKMSELPQGNDNFKRLEEAMDDGEYKPLEEVEKELGMTND